jgi:uncharacterized membrane protein YfcA
VTSADLLTLLVAELGVFITAFMKGAFGGGFAIIGIPMLSLVMDPIAAGGLLAPLFLLGDGFALRYWRPSTWSKPDLLRLVPAMILGIAIGYATLSLLDRRLVAIAMAAITLAFAAHWFFGGGQVVVRPRSTPLALAAGAASGVTTMVAHAGGPPLALYLLRLGLPKAVYAGTTSAYFMIANIFKTGPWLLVAQPTADLWLMIALCAPAVPLGVWAGWRLHQLLDQRQMYRACYGLLVVTALKLLWDGVKDFL